VSFTPATLPVVFNPHCAALCTIYWWQVRLPVLTGHLPRSLSFDTGDQGRVSHDGKRSNRDLGQLQAVVRAKALRLFKLAEYQARSMGEVRSEEDIHSELLSAFWLGELQAVNEESHSPINRFNVLDAVARTREHPGFTLVETADLLPQKVQIHPDGSVTVDSTNYVVLPKNKDDRTDEIAREALAKLAKTRFDDFADAIRPVLYGLAVRKEAYGQYCDLLELERPPFWFGQVGATRGFGGRPSAMRQIMAEMARRHKTGEIASKVREEAEFLAKWAKENLPAGIQAPQGKSIENAIRDRYHSLMSETTSHKT
jgi:hypothetical protein